MAFPLAKYNNIKNNFCIAYFGPNAEYIIQLKALHNQLEQHFKGLSIYFSCRQEFLDLAHEKTMSKEKLREQKNNFAYIYEVKSNLSTHPILDLLKESEVSIKKNEITQKNQDLKTAVLLPNGIHPTRSLTSTEVKQAKKWLLDQEYQLIDNIKQAGIVMGVENKDFFLAASQGIKTVLIPTGIGEELYKKLFSHGNIQHLA